MVKKAFHVIGRLVLPVFFILFAVGAIVVDQVRAEIDAHNARVQW